MKKIITILIVGCLTVHCQPPPERPKKDRHLHLENLIYSVALSSFKLAYQMDVKRKEHVLKQVKKQLEQERENSAIALKALEERVAVLIEEKNQSALGGDVSEKGVTLQIHEINALESPAESLPEEPLSLEENLAQLEALVFGEEGSDGFLFQIKFLQEKWALLNLSPSSAAELTEKPVSKASEAVDNESRVERLSYFIQGEGHFPGVHSQIAGLEEALSFISVTEDQSKTLTETVGQFVREQKDSIPEGASVEDRLTRLESLIHGSEDWKGIIPWIEHLQTQVTELNETSTDAPVQADDSGSEG